MIIITIITIFYLVWRPDWPLASSWVKSQLAFLSKKNTVSWGCIVWGLILRNSLSSLCFVVLRNFFLMHGVHALLCM